MAEDNDTGLAAEVVETNKSVEIPVVKKTRAPRQPKAAVAPANAVAETVVSSAPSADAEKPAGRGRGRKAKPVEESPKAPAKVKGTRMKKVAPSVSQAEASPSTALDEMEDLIQLEEENKRLRKLLSDKLRSENADLRKRLGHN